MSNDFHTNTNSSSSSAENPYLNSWAKPLLELQRKLMSGDLFGENKKEVLNNLLRYSRSLEKTLQQENSNLAQKVIDFVSDLEMVSRIERHSEKPLAPEVLHFLRSRIFDLKAPLQNQLPVFKNPLASQFEKGLVGTVQIEAKKVSLVFPIQEFLGTTSETLFSQARKDHTHCQIGEIEFASNMVPVFDLSLLISGKSSESKPLTYWVFGNKNQPHFAIPLLTQPEILFYQNHQFTQLNPDLRLSQKRSLLGIVRGAQGGTLPVINLKAFSKASR